MNASSSVVLKECDIARRICVFGIVYCMGKADRTNGGYWATSVCDTSDAKVFAMASIPNGIPSMEIDKLDTSAVRLLFPSTDSFAVPE